MNKLNMIITTSITIFKDDKATRVSIEDFAQTLAYEKLAESVFGLPEVTILSLCIFVRDTYKNVNNGEPYLRYSIEQWDGIGCSKYSGKIYEHAPITWNCEEIL